MNYFVIPPIITLSIIITIGLFVYSRNIHNKINQTFGLFCLSMIVWLIGFCAMYMSQDPAKALMWAKIGFIGVVFIPIFAYHFIITFLAIKSKALPYIYLTSVPAVLFNYFTSSIYAGVTMHYWGFYPLAGSFYFIFLIAFIALFFAGVVLLFRNLSNPKIPLMKQMQIRYVFGAFLIGMFGVVDYIEKYKGLNIYPFGYICALLFISIIAFAIIKYKLLDIRVAITRSGIFLTLYTLVLGIPFYLGSRTHSWLISTSFAVVLASVGPIIYKILQTKAENILLAEQRQYQSVLTHASRGMVEEHNLSRLLQLIVRIIKRTVKIQFVAAFIYDPETKLFDLRAIRASHKEHSDIKFKTTHSLIQYIHIHKEPFLLEDYEEKVNLCGEMGLDAELIVPSFVQDKCLGFLVLGKKMNEDAYTLDDLAVFKTLANQAALAIENSLFIEESKKTQELLFNAEKLSAIGGMADGLAHQIKNRLYEFAIVSQNMEFDVDDVRKKLVSIIEKDPSVGEKLDSLTGGTKTMINNVQKTNMIIKGILDFARTEQNDTAFSNFPLKEIIDPSVNLIMMKHRLNQFPLMTEIPEDGSIFGVKGQLQESIYNFLDNAYEAIREKLDYRLKDDAKKDFIPQILIRLCHNDTHDVIEIKDNGVGIKDGDKPKIFAAFFTTKPSSKSGSGIGSYVSKRMIEENHHGKMKFISKYMEGTTFLITLPRK